MGMLALNLGEKVELNIITLETHHDSYIVYFKATQG